LTDDFTTLHYWLPFNVNDYDQKTSIRKALNEKRQSHADPASEAQSYFLNILSPTTSIRT
jgi:hypothetical protein